MALGQHSASIQELEVAYFRCLCFAAFPALILASVNSFFSGRGETWIVLINDAVGLAVNALCANALIFGHFGFPAWGIVGAGWAAVAGTTTSALVALAFFLRRRYRIEFATADWRFDGELFRRLMRFGFPNGLQWMFDILAFTFFLFLVGRIGDVELAATNIAFSINTVGLLPMLGMGQAVSVLVGQGLGRDRPDLAARSTWTGFWLATTYIATVAVLYVLIPDCCSIISSVASTTRRWSSVAALVPSLLCFAAVYSVFDSMNIIFSFALRGAGDTRFVTLVALGLAWPCMVLPTWAAWYYRWDHAIYLAWAFASFFIIAEGFAFWLRFARASGKRCA